MIIIGHRGAAGLQPENTIPAIKAAVAEGVDRIEFDIRPTKDERLIVFHDANLTRIADNPAFISELTFKELSAITTKSGHPIPTFEQAIKAAGTVPVMIDAKGKNWSELLHKALKKHKGPTPIVTGVDLTELLRFHAYRPAIETYICEYINPFDAIYKARVRGLTGINISFWILNPLVYFYAKHHKLKLITFTVNKPLLARFLHMLYPEVALVTNVPHSLAPLAKRRNERSKGSTLTKR